MTTHTGKVYNSKTNADSLRQRWTLHGPKTDQLCFDCCNFTNHVDVRIAGRQMADATRYFIGVNPSIDSRAEIEDNPTGTDETRHTCGAFGVYLELIGGGIQCMEICNTLEQAREWLDDTSEGIDEIIAQQILEQEIEDAAVYRNETNAGA